MRKIITYGGYFQKFMSTLDEPTQKKIKYGLLLLKTQDRPQGSWHDSSRTSQEGSLYKVLHLSVGAWRDHSQRGTFLPNHLGFRL